MSGQLLAISSGISNRRLRKNLKTKIQKRLADSSQLTYDGRKIDSRHQPLGFGGNRRQHDYRHGNFSAAGAGDGSRSAFTSPMVR